MGETVTPMRPETGSLPDLAARIKTYHAGVTEHDFATVLDRRIKNMERIERERATGKVIEAPKVEVKPPLPRLADRRYRRL